MKNARWKVAQAAELRWWRRYLGRKPGADYLAWKADQWEKQLLLIEADLELYEGELVLDAGCGPAGVFTVLKGFKVDAVDPLLESYEESLQHFHRVDYPWVTFYSIPFEDFELPGHYHVVFCNNALNHFSNLHFSISHLVNAVKPGGQLVITVDAHNHAFFKHLFRLIPLDILHPHQYNMSEWEEMISSRHCKILRKERITRGFFFTRYLFLAEKPEKSE